LTVPPLLLNRYRPNPFKTPVEVSRRRARDEFTSLGLKLLTLLTTSHTTLRGTSALWVLNAKMPTKYPKNHLRTVRPKSTLYSLVSGSFLHRLRVYRVSHSSSSKWSIPHIPFAFHAAWLSSEGAVHSCIIPPFFVFGLLGRAYRTTLMTIPLYCT
jgi:hypothetical protein